MRAVSALFRRLYGDSVFHLIALLAALALTAYTVAVLGVKNLFSPTSWWQSIAVWFAVAIIAHDLILFPLYTLADRLLPRAGRPPRHRDGAVADSVRHIPLTNYVRLPTMAAVLLLVMFLPGIIEQGAPTYQAASGLTQAPFLTRWLLITAGLYLTSALGYVVTSVLRHRHSPDQPVARTEPETAPNSASAR